MVFNEGCLSMIFLNNLFQGVYGLRGFLYKTLLFILFWVLTRVMFVLVVLNMRVFFMFGFVWHVLAIIFCEKTTMFAKGEIKSCWEPRLLLSSSKTDHPVVSGKWHAFFRSHCLRLDREVGKSVWKMEAYMVILVGGRSGALRGFESGALRGFERSHCVRVRNIKFATWRSNIRQWTYASKQPFPFWVCIHIHLHVNFVLLYLPAHDTFHKCYGAKKTKKKKKNKKKRPPEATSAGMTGRLSFAVGARLSVIGQKVPGKIQWWPMQEELCFGMFAFFCWRLLLLSGFAIRCFCGGLLLNLVFGQRLGPN